MIAFPAAVWHRQRRRRKLNPDTLGGLSYAKFLQPWQLTVAVEVKTRLTELRIRNFPGEEEVPQFSFETIDGVGNVLPFAEALVAVAQDHFNIEFQTAEGEPGFSGLPVDPYESRFRKIEGTLESIAESLKGLTGRAIAGPVREVLNGFDDAAPDRFSGLGSSVVQQAIQAGVSTDALVEMAALARDPRGARIVDSGYKFGRGRGQSLPQPHAQLQNPGPPRGASGSAEGRAPGGVDEAVLQLTAIVQQLSEEKTRKSEAKDLESILDRAEGSGSGRDSSSGNLSRSQAAALRSLQMTLQREPKLMYQTTGPKCRLPRGYQPRL